MYTDVRKIHVPVEEILKELSMLPPVKLNYITFSGRGEPTLAANIGDAIRAVKALRKEPVAVLTNGSLMDNDRIREELSLADLVAVKLDAATQKLLQKINRPARSIELRSIVEGTKEFRHYYQGKLALQIMFWAANRDQVTELISLAERIRPDEIQINTPLRPGGTAPLSRGDIFRIKAAFFYARERGELDPGTNIVSVYDEIAPKDVLSISDDDTLKRRGKVKP
jgi:wyosine [tRNA(Phe)-imidazoG37] synthetase (radical SAM superfamily)